MCSSSGTGWVWLSYLTFLPLSSLLQHQPSLFGVHSTRPRDIGDAASHLQPRCAHPSSTGHLPSHMTHPHPCDVLNTLNGVLMPLGTSQARQMSVRRCPSLQDAAQWQLCIPAAARAPSTRYDMSNHPDTSSGPLTKVHCLGTRPQPCSQPHDASPPCDASMCPKDAPDMPNGASVPSGTSLDVPNVIWTFNHGPLPRDASLHPKRASYIPGCIRLQPDGT